MIHQTQCTTKSKRAITGILLGVTVMLMLIVMLPLESAQAWSPGDPVLPQCNKSSYDPQTGVLLGIQNPCGWQHLVTLAGNLLQFMFFLAVPIAAVAFAYAGLLYFTSRGSDTQIKKAHGIFTNVFWGIIIVLAAWAIVDLIVDELVDKEAYIQVLTEEDVTD